MQFEALEAARMSALFNRPHFMEWVATHSDVDEGDRGQLRPSPHENFLQEAHQDSLCGLLVWTEFTLHRIEVDLVEFLRMVDAKIEGAVKHPFIL